jgi:hypothetical protein
MGTLFLFILCTFPLTSLAAGSGNLKGFIYKKNGRTPRYGVQVLLKDVDTGQLFESNVTDALGDYKLRDVPTGLYRVLLLAKDKAYKIKKIDFLVRVFDGKTSTISFSLKKSGKPLFFFFRPCWIIAILAGVFAFVVAR